jgi:hypothetical protein
MSRSSNSLAYIFWHWPKDGVERAEYEYAIACFHRALADERPPGFRSSNVFRIPPLPWLAPDDEVYEDWYFIEGSAALDPLNEAAVAGRCGVQHDVVAHAAEGGTGALYRLMRGASSGGARFCAWLSKPRETTYDHFYGKLTPLLEGRVAGLWRRQMVLGPAPEFALRTLDRIELPEGLEAEKVILDPLLD